MPVAAMMRCSVILLSALLAAPAVAQAPVPFAPPAPVVQSLSPVAPPVVALAPDGRHYGHLPYAEASRALMAAMTDDIAPAKSCELHRDAAPALYRLMQAAQADGIVGLRAISCFRTVSHQTALFCGAGLLGACREPADRARSVAPGGHSEHATGYVVDFGAPGPDGCNDLDPCMSGTPGGLWLMRNAPRFGFELSFPSRNAQGVTWEPWHWRWVGATAADPGAAAARAVFARARREFPGNPRVADPPPAPVRLKPVDPARFVGPRD